MTFVLERKSSTARLTTTTLLMSLSVLSPAAAQQKVDGMIVLPCCDCIDGKSTKIDISTNGSTPWMVKGALVSGGGPIKPPAITNPILAWNSTTTAMAPAKWLQPSASATANTGFAQGDATYALTIRVPKCVIPMTIAINGKLASDDTAYAYFDPPSSTSNTKLNANFAGFSNTIQPITTTLNATPATAGDYVLRVDVNNAGGPAAMILNGALVATCSKRREL